MMTKKQALEKLIAQIEEAQESFHITGIGEVNDEYEIEYETRAGKTVIFRAVRRYSGRGLSYMLYHEEVSITKGHKVDVIGVTGPWARTEVIIEPVMIKQPL